MSVLTSLSLGRNEIVDDGAKALADALKVNNVLISLSLWSSSIGEEGKAALVEALPQRCPLSEEVQQLELRHRAPAQGGRETCCGSRVERHAPRRAFPSC